MKRVILFALLVPVMVHGQIIEDFEKGAFENWTESVEGHWLADSTQSLSGHYSLHHVYDNPDSGNDCIGIPLDNLHPDEGLLCWEFLVRHGYDPSVSNNWAVYLMSDAGPVEISSAEKSNGYVLGVNLKGYDDTLRIWKIKEGSLSVVVKCPLNWQNEIGTDTISRIAVSRSESGSWTISIRDSDNNLKCYANGYDNELFRASWFLLNYRYSSTRDRLLWFDDLKINGVFYRDTLAPEILRCSVTGKRSLEIEMNEDIRDDNLNPENFIPGNPGIQVTDAIRKTENIYSLVFSDDLNNKVINNLVINNICDMQGNCSYNVIIDFVPVWAEAGDVLFTEIMADPVPGVSLPEKEYLEITNRTQYVFNIENWVFRNGDKLSILPSGRIGPGEYVILCHVSDTSSFSIYGKTSGLKSFPALTDEGKLIALYDSTGGFIHGLEYSSGWYGDRLKEEGGWSLEIIDFDQPFFTKGNWETSVSKKGGTPGYENSVCRNNPDTFFEGIVNVFPADTVTLDLMMSESVPDFEDKVGYLLIDDVIIDSVQPLDNLFRQFRLTVRTPFKRDKVYNLHLSHHMLDFGGNPPEVDMMAFGIPEKSLSGEIVFNELLFYPFPDEPDYIELYNGSDKIIDLSGLLLASINETGDTSSVIIPAEGHRCFMPWSYYTVTTDRNKVIDRYFSSFEDAIFSIRSLPSMPADRGHLILLNRELDLIDEVIYSDEMHYSLLADKRGISLEKVRPLSASMKSMNWHSASESSGWGTPGEENSIFSRYSVADDRIILSSERITPDNDGFEDLLLMDLNLEGTANIVTVTIFDETGTYVKRVAEKLFAGSQATIIWDGTAEDGYPVRTGIYILLIELYNDQGKTKSWKKVCTVIRN